MEPLHEYDAKAQADHDRTERWIRVERLFKAAFEQPPERQESLLRAADGSDSDIVEEVRELLALDAGAPESFLTALDMNRAAGFLTHSVTTWQSGDRIGPYVVEREIGRGGMAVIYEVRDPRLERDVALKLLSPVLATDPDAKRRLLAEARAASHLDHPNVATVLDIGETDDGQMWIAMPRYRGSTLREHIARGPIPVSEALRIATQLARGLAAAHASGIIHRDVKPANVMITQDGIAKILDFGIARMHGQTLTNAGTTVGTVAYMSPEQSLGETVDERTDIWALGVVLYEMLSGRRPFRGDNDSAVILGIRHDAPPPLRKLEPNLPTTVVRIVERCLEKERDRRFPNADELADALGAAGMPSSIFARLPARPRRTATFAAGILVLILLFMLVARPFWRGTGRGIHPSATSLIILPFATAVKDSALERLGVDLSITLARALDGVGNVRVDEPLSVLSGLRPRVFVSFDDGLRLARERGARGLVHGTLVRDGDGVRIDATLHTTEGTRIAQVVFNGEMDVTALTDGVAIELLRHAWRGAGAPVPNLAAITTHSIPALRAYLEGERAIAEGRLRDAPDGFERAIALDSTFWFAYWRLWYVLDWHNMPVDSVVRRTVAANIASLPDADSALASTRLVSDLLQRHELLRDATRSFPNYWPAWFDLADLLVHHGPYLGFRLVDARAALEQVVALNPDLVPAWEHFYWVAIRERDVPLTDRIFRELERLRIDSLRAAELRYDVMLYYDYLAALVRSGGDLDSARLTAGAALLAGMRGRTPQQNLSSSLHTFGFHRAQLRVLDRILEYDPAPDIRAANDYGRALSWAARGAWDSALVAAGRYARAERRSDGALLAARIAAVGGLVGGLDAGAAEMELDVAIEAASSFGMTPAERAEATWLQGVSAFTRNDRAEIDSARGRALALVSGSGSGDVSRSLAALAVAAAGNRAAAADSLAALELATARRGRHFEFARTRPFFSAINRLLAARWLIDAGRADIAEPLLFFPDATFPSELRPSPDANLTLAPLVLIERARVAAARGRSAEAHGLTNEAFTRLDQPTAAMRQALRGAR